MIFVLRRIRIKFSFGAGFLYGVVLYALLCFWLFFYNFWAGFFVCLWEGFLFSLLFFSFSVIFKKNSRFAFILNSFLFLFFEWIGTKGYLGFSYGVLGYTQWKIAPFVKSSYFFGVWGTSFLLILVNFHIAEFIESILTSKKNTFLIKISSIAVIVFMGVLICSSFIPVKDFSAKKLNVLLIQSNSDPWKEGIDEYEREVSYLIDLTNSALKEYPDVHLVVWPESAVVVDVLTHFEQKKDLRRYKLAENFFDYVNKLPCPLLLGNNHKDFNCAVLFTPESEKKVPKSQVYQKNHLVPFSEDFPVCKLLLPIRKKMESAGNYFWHSGKKITLLDLNGIKIGAPVCFEDTFSDIPKTMRKLGADLFVNLSNDSWSKSVACQYQHLSIAVFRSAENRIPELRCTNSGQTCFINSFGKLESMIKPFESTWLYCEVKLNRVE